MRPINETGRERNDEGGERQAASDGTMRDRREINDERADDDKRNDNQQQADSDKWQMVG